MYEKVENCPTCNYPEFNSYTIADDHTVSKESFAIVQCANCGMLITSPRPTIDHISKYYQSEDYISHTNQTNNLTHFIYKIARFFTLRQKNHLLKSLTKDKKILDYGCGAGVLIEYLNKKGWQPTGIEPDDKTRKRFQEENDLPVYRSLQDLSKDKFDIITLWHVLEHVHDLNTTMQRLRAHLKKKGRIVIAVPNHDSYDRKHYKENWAAYDVPRHLYHFTQNSMTEFMKYHKFKMHKVIPMKLDAYYVSLLSEKIASGKSKFLSAFIQGLISNNFAKRNNGDYSSLIYVFSKS